MSQNTGKICQIIGPVVDVTFEKQSLEMPDIYDALEIKRDDGTHLVVECQQHIGERTVGQSPWILQTVFAEEWMLLQPDCQLQCLSVNRSGSPYECYRRSYRWNRFSR